MHPWYYLAWHSVVSLNQRTHPCPSSVFDSSSFSYSNLCIISSHFLQNFPWKLWFLDLSHFLTHLSSFSSYPFDCILREFFTSIFQLTNSFPVYLAFQSIYYNFPDCINYICHLKSQSTVCFVLKFLSEDSNYLFLLLRKSSSECWINSVSASGINSSMGWTKEVFVASFNIEWFSWISSSIGWFGDVFISVIEISC